MPLRRWLQEWPMPDPSPALAFTGAVLGRLVAAHREGRSDERLFLWCWLVLRRHNDVATPR